MSKCMVQHKEQAVRCGHPYGEADLRQQIAKHLAGHRGIKCVPEQVIVGAGTQHCLEMISVVLRTKLDRIAVEEPGYNGAKAAFKNSGLKILPIQLAADGIKIEELINNDVKAVYITPSHQYPLGVVMPIAKRTRLLEWAHKNNALIIEDDYNSYFRYGTRPIPSLLGMSADEQIIYLGSFSKSFLPSLRLSYMVLPLPLLNKFQQIFCSYSPMVPFLPQKALATFMSLGYWDSHLRKMNFTYKKKHDLLIKSLENQMPDLVEIYGKNAGLHLAVRVNSRFSEKMLIEKAANAGVRVSPSSVLWANPSLSKESMILLGFSGIRLERIEAGIKHLRKAWFT